MVISDRALVSRYSHLFGRENRRDVLEHLEQLMATHPAEDVRVKARMVHSVITARTKGAGDGAQGCRESEEGDSSSDS